MKPGFEKLHIYPQVCEKYEIILLGLVNTQQTVNLNSVLPMNKLGYSSSYE